MELYTNSNVIVGFILSIVALFILGFYSYQNNQKFLQARAAIFHTSRVLYHVKPVNFDKFLDAVSQVGLFWMLLNQTPAR